MSVGIRGRITSVSFFLALIGMISIGLFFSRLYIQERSLALFQGELARTTQTARLLETTGDALSRVDAAGAVNLSAIVAARDLQCLQPGTPPSPVQYSPKRQITDSSDLRQTVVDAVGQIGCQQLPALPGWTMMQGPQLQDPTAWFVSQDGVAGKVVLASMDGLSSLFDSARLIIADPAGKMLWTDEPGSRTDRMLTAILRDAPELLGASAADGGHSNSRSGIRELRLGIVAYAPVGRDKILLSILPASLANGPVNFVMEQAALLLTAVLFLCLFIGRVTSRIITQPLTHLSQVSEQFGNGDLLARVGAIRGRDEIAAVSRSFNAMADHIVGLLDKTKAQAAIESEIFIANQVQSLLIPERRLRKGGHELESYVAMADKCGGDWWGYLEIPQPTGQPLLVMLIGDVTGHGISSALITAAAQGALSVLSDWIQGSPAIARDPNEILRIFNEAVYRTSRGTLRMTFLAAVFDPQNQSVYVGNAGHNFPYLRTSAGDRWIPANIAGPVMGDSEHAQFEPFKTFPWKPGSQMVLYTDGLTDCLEGERQLFDRRALNRAMTAFTGYSPNGLLSKILEARKAAAGHLKVQADDVTLVVVGCPEAPAGAST
jgi:serine phosphatase RsbU (regulator of sigma subunit)/HAMP domain-containing protein